MIERDSCYFCTSSFQLFAITALAIERKETADLYIDPQFKDAEIFAARLKGLDIFQNVELIDSKRIYGKYMSAGPGFINHLQIANTYLNVEDIAQTILLEGVSYGNICLSSKADLPRMVQLYCIKAKKSVQTYYFDDGAGSYENDRAYKISTSDRILRSVLFGKSAAKTDYEKFLFSSEIYSELNEGDRTLVKPIVRFWDKQSGKEIINKVFGVKNKPDIKERLIILDQPKDELFASEDLTRINSIYNSLIQKLGYENVVVKKHPRSSDEDFTNIKNFESQGVPFELYCLNMDMDRKIIVTHSSTAAATPKILFDQEPIVIVLSKLIETIAGEKNLFVEFFEAVKKAYRNPERLYIPSNEQELSKIIEIIV